MNVEDLLLRMQVNGTLLFLALCSFLFSPRALSGTVWGGLVT